MSLGPSSAVWFNEEEDEDEEEEEDDELVERFNGSVSKSVFSFASILFEVVVVVVFVAAVVAKATS